MFVNIIFIHLYAVIVIQFLVINIAKTRNRKNYSIYFVQHCSSDYSYKMILLM